MAEHTHEFDCKQCGVHLDSQRELDDHNRKQHAGQSASSGSSSSSSGSSGNSSSSGGRIS